MSAPASEKRRKLNFSFQEKEVIIRAMSRYDVYLHGAESANTTKARKTEILTQIAADVNALGYEVRSSNDILKKINDLHRLVRGKLSKIRTHASGTGGGPATTLMLTPDEQVVAQCLHRHQVEGFDSIEDALRTGKCVFFLLSGV